MARRNEQGRNTYEYLNVQMEQVAQSIAILAGVESAEDSLRSGALLSLVVARDRFGERGDDLLALCIGWLFHLLWRHFG